MYLDEYGNEWASYEDYQNYLEVAKNINHNKLIKDLFSGAYIAEDGTIWESEEKYLESGKNNE